jgi:hypothetical protein
VDGTKDVEASSCTVTTTDATSKATTFEVAFTTWGQNILAENNVFFHDGNPPLSAFHCATDGILTGDSVACTVTDVINAEIREHMYCSGRGVCDFVTGLCTCWASASGPLTGFVYTGPACNKAFVAPIAQTENSLVLEVADTAFVGNVVHLESQKVSASDFKFMKVSNDVAGEILTVLGDGSTTLSHGGIVLEDIASKIDVAVGVVVNLGGVNVTDGGATVVHALDRTKNTHVYPQGEDFVEYLHSSEEFVGHFHSSNALFSGTVLSLNAAETHSDNYKAIDCVTNAETVFEVLGSGKVNINKGGLSVNHGASVEASDETGSATADIMYVSKNVHNPVGPITTLMAPASNTYLPTSTTPDFMRADFHVFADPTPKRMLTVTGQGQLSLRSKLTVQEGGAIVTKEHPTSTTDTPLDYAIIKVHSCQS